MIDETGYAAEVADAKSTWQRVETDIDTIAKRIEVAIENWYAKHFHKAVLSGTAPLSADDKASLVEQVTSAVNPKE